MNSLEELRNIAKSDILSLSEKELEMVLAILKSEKEGESC